MKSRFIEKDADELEEVDIFENRWQYRGEGNANIVIAVQDLSVST